MSDRKKAIETLKQLRLDYEEFYEEHNNEVTQAYDMAISSLETDEAYQLEYESTTKNETLVSLGVYKQVAWERDIAIEQLHELGYEFGQKIEPTAKNDLGVDAVSRQVVIDTIFEECSGTKLDIDFAKVLMLQRAIKALPSVTPQEPKTGYCKDCKYFEYDTVAKVDGMRLILAHEICSRWGDGCKTKEDGYCFLFEPKESEEKE